MCVGVYVQCCDMFQYIPAKSLVNSHQKEYINLTDVRSCFHYVSKYTLCDYSDPKCKTGDEGQNVQ